MKFDRKYPDAQYLDEPQIGIVKSDTEMHCSICDEVTEWFQLDFAAAVCSEECLEKLLTEYEAAERGNPDETSFSAQYR